MEQIIVKNVDKVTNGDNNGAYFSIKIHVSLRHKAATFKYLAAFQARATVKCTSALVLLSQHVGGDFFKVLLRPSIIYSNNNIFYGQWRPCSFRIVVRTIIVTDWQHWSYHHMLYHMLCYHMLYIKIFEIKSAIGYQ